jgi:hypothetical protein
LAARQKLAAILTPALGVVRRGRFERPAFLVRELARASCRRAYD